MASLSHAQSSAIADPIPRSRPRTKARSRKRTQARARGGILWIAISGILLAGVVFVNVAVLQLNLRLDNANADKAKLQADNAALQSQYSSLVSSPRVSAAAYRRLGLVFLDPATYTYIDVARR